MKNAVVIILLFAFLAAPARASAFGFGDIITYGRKVFKMKEPSPAPVKVDEKKVDRALSVDVRNQWKEKYRVWKNAYQLGEVAPVMKNKKNLRFTEEELNYFSEKEFDTATTSVVRNLRFDLVPGAIKVSGYSFFKMMKGEFSAEVKVLKGVDGLYLKVAKARLGKVWVPAVLLDNMIRTETKELKRFLYSNKDYQDLEVIIDDDSLELKYQP